MFVSKIALREMLSLLPKTSLPPFCHETPQDIITPVFVSTSFYTFSLWWLIAVINLMWFWIVMVTNIWTCLNMSRDCLDLVKLRRPTLYVISTKLLPGILDWLKRRRGAEQCVHCYVSWLDTMRWSNSRSCHHPFPGLMFASFGNVNPTLLILILSGMCHSKKTEASIFISMAFIHWKFKTLR